MSIANVPENLRRALASGGRDLIDPGTGETVNLRGKDFMVARNFGAGTYKLPVVGSESVGACVVIIADGAQSWTNAAGTARATLASGEVGLAYAVSTSDWKIHVVSGAGDDLATSLTTALDTAVFSDNNASLGGLVVSNTIAGMYDHLLATSGCVDIPLSCFREVDADGDVGNNAALGGLITSETTPILEAVGTTNAHRLNFATGVVDRIAASVSCPSDMDGTADALVEFIVSSAGTTNSWNTAVLVTNWNGGADVVDALTDTATTAVKVAPATIAAADVADVPLTVTVSVTPPTHASDALYIYGARLRYKKKLTT
jgi:hypothetical protein